MTTSQRMLNTVTKLWIGIISWLARSKPELPELPDLTEPKPEPEQEPKPTHARVKDVKWDFSRKGVEQGGVFYFRKDILDRLDYYFAIISRFRRYDPDNYSLYSRIGATLLPYEMLTTDFELPPQWYKKRPAFGCFVFGDGLKIRSEDHPTAKTFYPKFVYFHKMRTTAPTVELAPGEEVYRISVYFDSLKPPKWARKYGASVEYHIAITSDNKMRMLKERQQVMKTIKFSKLPSGRKTTKPASFTQDVWAYPEGFMRWVNEDRSNLSQKVTKDPQEFAVNFFRRMAGCYTAIDTGIRVDVKKNDVSAVFCIDIKRTAYFFRDRNSVLNERGKTARIFHIVRPHSRKTKKGPIDIRMHFRGLRSFNWHGHTVRISMPGLHHTPISEFTDPGTYLAPGEPMPEGWKDLDFLGRKFRKYVDTH